MQKWRSDIVKMEQLMTNMKKVEKRGYIVDGFVQSITRVFDVPKGEVNVQVVYDATSIYQMKQYTIKCFSYKS